MPSPTRSTASKRSRSAADLPPHPDDKDLGQGRQTGRSSTPLANHTALATRGPRPRHEAMLDGGSGFRETKDASPPDAHLLHAGGIDHGPAPTWSRVAEEWDAVHLTFAGLLTARYAPVISGALTTTLWSWDYECTHWLRSAFSAVQPLPELLDPPQAPALPGLP